MKPTCIDASVIIKWVLPEEMNYTAARMYQAALHKHITLVAPACAAFRVVQGLGRWVDAGCLTAGEGREALARLEPLMKIVEWVSLPGNDDEGYVLVNGDDDRWIYDRGYIAVARARAADLWTADRGLARELYARYDFVRWLGDFK